MSRLIGLHTLMQACCAEGTPAAQAHLNMLLKGHAMTLAVLTQPSAYVEIHLKKQMAQ